MIWPTEKVRDPVFAADSAYINCMIKDEALGWIPYTASAASDHPRCLAVYQAALAMGPAPAPAPPAGPTEAEVLAAWRENRVLTRTEFCTALLRAGKLSAAEAIAAAGGATPAPLEDAISMLPEPEQAEARILWAGLTQVRRNHPLIALVAWVPSVSMTDEEVDALFGWPEV